MDLFSLQITVLLCLLLGNILFGSIPSLLGRVIGHFSCGEEAWNRKVKCVTFLFYIGVGVFISDSFLVLLPEANQEITNHRNHSHEETGKFDSQQNSISEQNGEHHHDSFPIPEFVVLCGFFLAYVFQETVYFLLSKCNRTTTEANDLRVRFCSCAKRHTECSRTFKAARPDQTLFGFEKKLMESGNTQSSTGAAAIVAPEVEVNANSDLLRSSILAQAVPNYGTLTNVAEPATDNPLPILTPPVLLADERRLVMAQHAEAIHQNKFIVSSMLIVITLTLQFVFQGIHLGIRIKDSNRWPYLLVACLQNFVLTFSAGSYFAVGNMEFAYLALVIGLLSTVSPLGLIAAMVEKNAVEEISHLTIGIVSAIACGILLYTTFCEMLRKKHFRSVVGIIKFLAVTIGASIMIALHYATLTL